MTGGSRGAVVSAGGVVPKLVSALSEQWAEKCSAPLGAGLRVPEPLGSVPPAGRPQRRALPFLSVQQTRRLMRLNQKCFSFAAYEIRAHLDLFHA